MKTEGLEERVARLEGRRKRRKGIFRNCIIVADLVFLAYMSVWAFRLVEQGQDPSATYAVLAGVFGGELLLLMAKRVFGDRKKEEADM